MARAADLIVDCNKEIGAVLNQVTALRAAFDASRAAELAERVKSLETKVAELERVRAEAERRHWQFVYIFAGAMASLLVTVVVQLVLAAVKK